MVGDVLQTLIIFGFIAAIVLVMIGVILRCFHKEMHLQTVLCAIISII